MDKKCARCKEILDISNFSKMGEYFYSYCYKCKCEYSKEKYSYKKVKKEIYIIEGEKWKDIPLYEGVYMISNMGRVMSLNRKNAGQKILAPTKTNFGYILVKLFNNKTKRQFLVHRLVGSVFINNINNKRCINHINCNKEDNRAENLEWVSYTENQLHSYKNGLRKSKLGVKYGKRIKKVI